MAYGNVEHKWAQAARERMKKKGTVGKLTEKAHRAGESPMEFAREHYHSPGDTGAEARFAVNINKHRR